MTEQIKVGVWTEYSGDFLERDLHDRNHVLRCPACGSGNTHLCGVRSIVGVEDQKQTALSEHVRDGTFPFEGSVDPVVGDRGAQIELGLTCEGCSHVIVIGLQFHKGSVFVKWKSLGEDQEGLQADDLWRS